MATTDTDFRILEIPQALIDGYADLLRAEDKANAGLCARDLDIAAAKSAGFLAACGAIMPSENRGMLIYLAEKAVDSEK